MHKIIIIINFGSRIIFSFEKFLDVALDSRAQPLVKDDHGNAANFAFRIIKITVTMLYDSYYFTLVDA